jgi:hypothetical protein
MWPRSEAVGALGQGITVAVRLITSLRNPAAEPDNGPVEAVRGIPSYSHPPPEPHGLETGW